VIVHRLQKVYRRLMFGVENITNIGGYYVS
jgi:hypothetical protein